jgi:predicted amidohydrolase YtcJ
MNRTIEKLIASDVFGHPATELKLLELAQGKIARILPITIADATCALEPGSGSVLDLRGLTVLPGLIDAHVHAIATGMLLLGQDLHDTTTLAELEAAVRQHAAQAEDYLRLGGLDLSRLRTADAARLNRTWLDALAPQRPLIIKSVEGHSSWFNSLAWQRLEISAMLEHCAVPAAEAQAMWDSGRVYGEAYENLANAIYDTYSAAERREGMRRLLKQAAAAGLTGIHCLEGYGARRRDDFELIRELDGQGCHLTLYARDSTPALAKELGLRRFGGCWCVDGAIGSHTAALGEPYADHLDSCGTLYYSDEELRAWIESGLRENMQVCVHAIGDRALQQVVAIYEQLATRYDLVRLRPRVDHFILGTPELAQRASRLGLCSAMQPAFDARWGGTTGGYATRLGEKRALQTNPVGGMLRAGLRIAGSSDSYITPLDPLGGIRAAMAHHNPEHRVDLETAVKLFTSDAAYLAHQEQSRGTIAEGFGADFTVVKGELGSEKAAIVYTIVGAQISCDNSACVCS